MSRAPHLVVMAAGTGGHIMPGLAVAREMQSRGWTVSWLGTTHGMENRLVPPTGIELDRVDFQGLRGKGWLHTLAGVFKLGAAFVRCAAILRRRRADAVLGMGGYVCFPGGVAARVTGRPLVLVNADAGLLLSNRSLSRMAQHIAFGFEGEASRQMPQAVVTGNPVRADIEALPEPAVRWTGRQGPLRLLVVGGSLGAQVLNRVVPAALAALPAQARPQILHQTGLSQQAEVASAYAQAGIAADARPFIDDMAQALADCDLVICRAGAITVSELCAAGVPSILVPLIVSTTSHQRDNALWLERQGAAWHLPQAELNVQRLVELLQTLDRPALLARAERARAAARPCAAARVADLIEPLLPASLGAQGASA